MRSVVLAMSTAAIWGMPAQAASPFNGSYAGKATWADSGNARCTISMDFTVNVPDRTFNFGQADARISIAVGPDGSFSGQSGQR